MASTEDLVRNHETTEPGKDEDKVLIELFNMIDDDESGTLEKKEILRALMFNPQITNKIKQFPTLSAFLKPRHFKDSFVKLDTKTSGHVTVEEFITFAQLNIIKTNELTNETNENNNKETSLEKNLKELYSIINVDNNDTVPKKSILKALALNVKVMTKIHELDGLDKLLNPHHFDDAFHSMPTKIQGEINELEFIGFAKTILIDNNKKEEGNIMNFENDGNGNSNKTDEEGNENINDQKVQSLTNESMSSSEGGGAVAKEEETSVGKGETLDGAAVDTVIRIDNHADDQTAQASNLNEEEELKEDKQDVITLENEADPQIKKNVEEDIQENMTARTESVNSIENENKNALNIEAETIINEIVNSEENDSTEKSKSVIAETNVAGNKKNNNSSNNKLFPPAQQYSNQMYLPALSLSPTKPKRILLPNGRGNKWSFKNGIRTKNMTYEEMCAANRQKIYSPQKLPSTNEWGNIDNSYTNRPSEPTPFSASFATREEIRSPIRSPTSLFLQEEQSKEGRKARKELKKAIQARYNQVQKVHNVYSNSMKIKSNDKPKRKSPRAQPHHLLRGAHKQYNMKPTRPSRKLRNLTGGKRGRKGMATMQQYKDIDTRIDMSNDNVDTTRDQAYDEIFDLGLKTAEVKTHPCIGPLEREMKARSNEIQAEMKELRYKAIIQQAKLKRLFETGSNILPPNSILDNKIDETIKVYKSEAMKAAKKQKAARLAAAKAHYQWLLTIDDSVQASIDNKLDTRVQKALDDAHSVERREVLAEKRTLERQRRKILIDEYKQREISLFKSNESRPPKPTVAQEYEHNLMRKKKHLKMELQKKRKTRMVKNNMYE
jgi:hypothetical protein